MAPHTFTGQPGARLCDVDGEGSDGRTGPSGCEGAMGERYEGTTGG